MARKEIEHIASEQTTFRFPVLPSLSGHVELAATGHLFFYLLCACLLSALRVYH